VILIPPALQPQTEIITLEQYEALSEDPSDDYIKKAYYYENYGVREYWIVDPKRKTVTVNYFEKNEVSIQLFFESAIKVNIYDDLYINFSDICKRLSI